MVKIIWTQRALFDLEDIGEYISKDSTKYAKLTLEKLLNTADLISNNPFFGRKVPETNDENIREVIKGNYRVIYQIKNENTVYILTVYHTARLLSDSKIT
ncbi:MAG: type II toxin-antitoxin system RelE/ParE family toxin [Bacteroidota bacterium]|nr:type II toxin-antitoxin system RelE/ParE family toxin [Bacteroidota bacterium]